MVVWKRSRQNVEEADAPERQRGTARRPLTGHVVKMDPGAPHRSTKPEATYCLGSRPDAPELGWPA